MVGDSDSSSGAVVIGAIVGVVFIFLGIIAWSRIDSSPPVPTEAEVAARNLENQATFEQILTATMNDDPAWSAFMEAGLRVLIESDEDIPEHRQLEITCAAALCQVTALIPGAEQNLFLGEQFLLPITRAFDNETPEALAWGTPDGNGGLRYQVWLAREGNTELLDT